MRRLGSVVGCVLLLASAVALPAAAQHTVYCRGRVATIVGTTGDDVMQGTSGADVIAGLAGADVITGLDGDDVLCGGPGADVIVGGRGADVLYGGPGADVLRAGLGRDLAKGGPGDDVLRGGPGADALNGGLGSDGGNGGRGPDRCRRVWRTACETVPLAPAAFSYVGAFRLPPGEHGDSRFGYGGSVMALRPDGDASGPDDGHPGSLFIGGHPHHQLVAEVSIPAPSTSDIGSLPVAEILQPFGDVTGGVAATEIGDFRLGGLEYHEGRLHWAAWRWYNVSGTDVRGHGSSTTDLADPDPSTAYSLAGRHNQLTGGYLFTAPADWAAEHTDGRRLVSGLNSVPGNATTNWGPGMFAFDPPALDAIRTGATTLAYYPYRGGTEADQNFPEHRIPDEWGGAAWVRVGVREAVVVVGRKALGETYYGPGREGDCSSYKGYHGDPYESQMLLFDPADLAAVAAGDKKPWRVAPYARISPGDLFPDTCDAYLDDVAFDARTRRLYVLQPNGDRVSQTYEGLPLVHVFQLD